MDTRSQRLPRQSLRPPVGVPRGGICSCSEIYKRETNVFIMIIVKNMARNCKYVVGRGRAGRMCHRGVSESACRICVGLYVLLCVGGLSAALGFTSQSLGPAPWGGGDALARPVSMCACLFCFRWCREDGQRALSDPGPQGTPGEPRHSRCACSVAVSEHRVLPPLSPRWP